MYKSNKLSFLKQELIYRAVWGYEEPEWVTRWEDKVRRRDLMQSILLQILQYNVRKDKISTLVLLLENMRVYEFNIIAV